MLAEYVSIISKIEGMLSKYECVRYNDIMLSQYVIIVSKLCICQQIFKKKIISQQKESPRANWKGGPDL